MGGNPTVPTVQSPTPYMISVLKKHIKKDRYTKSPTDYPTDLHNPLFRQ
jgi:hypothetical protein